MNYVVDAKFKFIPVNADTLPPEFLEWQRAAKSIMSASRCGRDLTEQDETFILNIDNGDWDSEDWTHLCLGKELCLAECGGDPETAKSLMKEAAQRYSGKLGTTPFGIPMERCGRVPWHHVSRS